LPMGQRFGHFGKIRYGLKKAVMIFEEISDQAIGHRSAHIRVRLEKTAEVKIQIVKCIDQLPHGLNALAELLSVSGKLCRTEVLGLQGGLHRVSCHYAAFQGQEES